MGKVLVVFTGGTIGSRDIDNSIDVQSEGTYLLINKYVSRFGREHTFDTCEPYCILSENISLDNICVLLNVLKESVTKDYDGIIVTHGTDTLDYTAAFVSMCFSNIDLPIVFVSSNKPIETSGSNGLQIFEAAVKFIFDIKSKGVYVITTKDKLVFDVHVGTRLIAPDYYNGDFGYFNGKPYRSFIIRGNRIDTNVCTDTSVLKSLRQSEFKAIDVPYNIDSRVQIIKQYPGFSFDSIKVQSNTKYVLIEAYHSGTLCVDNGFHTFMNKMNDLGVKVFCASVPNSKSLYASTNEADKYNVSLLKNISIPSAFAKLTLIANSDKDYDIYHNYFMEHVD